MEATTTLGNLKIHVRFEGDTPTEITIRSDQGIKNQDMRAVAWGQVFAELRGSGVDPDLARDVERALERPLDAYSAPERKAVVAAVYALAVEQGSASPIAEVERRTGGNRESLKTWVRQARSLGLLSATRPGEPGGSLTEEGREALRKARDF